MKKNVITFLSLVITFFFVGCSNGEEFIEFGEASDANDIKNTTQCLNENGIKNQVKGKLIYIQKSKLDKATSYCS
jgi:uncharacterized lipoprotein NlpE involved in copper resistance